MSSFFRGFVRRWTPDNFFIPYLNKNCLIHSPIDNFEHLEGWYQVKLLSDRLSSSTCPKTGASLVQEEGKLKSFFLGKSKKFLLEVTQISTHRPNASSSSWQSDRSNVVTIYQRDVNRFQFVMSEYDMTVPVSKSKLIVITTQIWKKLSSSLSSSA